MKKLVALSLVLCLSQTSNAMLSRMAIPQARQRFRNHVLTMKNAITPDPEALEIARFATKCVAGYAAFCGVLVGIPVATAETAKTFHEYMEYKRKNEWFKIKNNN